jgi:hypothetical protein
VKPYRILVTGSRDATEEHRDEIEQALMQAVGHIQMRHMESVILVHGDQRGVDRMAADIVTGWAEPHPQPEPHNAAGFGPWPAAGPKRNDHMVSLGADICLGFALPGSRGTWDCAKKAADAGIPTILRTLRGASPKGDGDA